MLTLNFNLTNKMFAKKKIIKKVLQQSLYVDWLFKEKVETYINKPEKIWVPNGIWTHDLLNTGRTLYWLGYKDSEES